MLPAHSTTCILIKSLYPAQKIILLTNDILVGVNKADGEYVTVPDRKDAIRYAILNAKDGDVIILAGKGHEDYQEIKGVKHPMDERVLIKEIIEEDQVKAIL